MSRIERLLLPGSTEGPDCRCGREMQLFERRLLQEDSDAERRTYCCDACGHRLKLIVWPENA
jgi:hypothetical protein